MAFFIFRLVSFLSENRQQPNSICNQNESAVFKEKEKNCTFKLFRNVKINLI